MIRELSLDEAKQVWDRFVPDKQIWTDDWDIRVALCKEFNYEPHILYDGKNFFPLQYDPDKGIHEIIGGDTAEQNYLTFDPEFMKTTKDIPEDVYFDFMTERFEGCVEGLCPQFFIDLSAIDGIDGFLERFSAKHAKNFRRAIKQFGDYEFVRKGTIKEMGELNIGMFGEKSDFASKEGRVCYDILDKDPRTEYWSVVKDGKIALVTQYFFYNKTMSVCVWGVDEHYQDTMKIAVAEAIKLAKCRGCNRIDYAPTYSSWKFLYRLDTAPLWRYKRGSIPDSVERPGYEIPPDDWKKLKEEGRI
jgi:hypothetical protein